MKILPLTGVALGQVLFLIAPVLLALKGYAKLRLLPLVMGLNVS